MKNESKNETKQTNQTQANTKNPLHLLIQQWSISSSVTSANSHLLFVLQILALLGSNTDTEPVGWIAGIVGSGWYVWSGAVVWRHMDMHETWDSVQWLWTLTSGNSVDADLWESEVTRGSTSFLFEKGRESKTENEGRVGERGTHKRGYWLVWREERGRLMMPELTSGNNGGFLIIYISIQESISGTLVRREIECPVRHTCVCTGRKRWLRWLNSHAVLIHSAFVHFWQQQT